MKLLSLIFAVLILTLSASATPIPQGTAQTAATWAAESVFGQVNLLESKVLRRADGNNSAYCFIFGQGDVTSIDESIILEGYNLRQTGMIEEGWYIARDPESYAYVIVSVDDQYGPVLEMCDGLPAHKIFREDVKDMGELVLGQNVQLIDFFYLFPLENWYRVTTDRETAIVNPRRMLIYDETKFSQFESMYDLPGNPTAPYYWQKVTTQPVPAHDDEGYIPDVPNFNQVDTDCGPHSSAQAAGYWDDHTYMGSGPWDLLIDIDFWGLRDEMRSAMGWISGSGVTMSEINDGIESVCNDPAYSNNYSFDTVLHDWPDYTVCTDAVDGGRPGVVGVLNHPIYGNHAMTLVGYNDTPTQMIQVHDNWPPSNDEPWLDWGVWFDGYVDVFPGGGGATTPITLASFSGTYEDGTIVISWVTACEVDCYGYNILRSEGGSFMQVNTEGIFANGSSCETSHYQLIDQSVLTGKVYTYQLETIFDDGRAEISATVKVKTLTQSLEQNVPNPFNPTTTIRYQVPKAGPVTLTVYDVMGHQVTTLVNEHQETNSYSVEFNGFDLASGIYFYKLEMADYTSIRKMVLMK